jgi:hypothetical protein
VAARTLCPCVLFCLVAGQPGAAQQSPSSTPGPPSQNSAQQPAQPAASQTQPQPAPQPPPAPQPISSDQLFTGNVVSVSAIYWLSFGHPNMFTGHANTNGEPSDLDFPGHGKATPWIVGRIPISKDHSIRISYFRTKGDGDMVAPANEIIYGTSYYTGDLLATSYTIQNAKVSLDYLSWPFPVKDAKFRIKTLWEVQATWISPTIDAPLRAGETDAAGNLITTTAYGTDWFVYPSFGLGFDYLASRNFRVEGRASGFAFPHRSTVWDTELSLNYRFSKFELVGGFKGFHFKTSPGQVEFLSETLSGAFVGLRWYLGTVPR